MHINTRTLGLQPERFEDMITAALREAHSTYPVPRMMNRSQMRAILQRKADAAHLLLKSHIEQSKAEVRKITLHTLHEARRRLASA